MGELEFTVEGGRPRAAYPVDRPEVRSRGGEPHERALRQQIERSRGRVRALAAGDCVGCPAGRLAAAESPDGMVVRCGVERSLVSERRDPSSLASFCLPRDGYQDCPSWRAEKERVWAGRPPLVAAGEGV